MVVVVVGWVAEGSGRQADRAHVCRRAGRGSMTCRAEPNKAGRQQSRLLPVADACCAAVQHPLPPSLPPRVVPTSHSVLCVPSSHLHSHGHHPGGQQAPQAQPLPLNLRESGAWMGGCRHRKGGRVGGHMQDTLRCGHRHQQQVVDNDSRGVCVCMQGTSIQHISLSYMGCPTLVPPPPSIPRPSPTANATPCLQAGWMRGGDKKLTHVVVLQPSLPPSPPLPPSLPPSPSLPAFPPLPLLPAPLPHLCCTRGPTAGPCRACAQR